MQSSLRWRIFVPLVLFTSIASTPRAHAGVWGDTWGGFVWGQTVLGIAEGLNLYAPTAELNGTVGGCFDLLAFLGGAGAVDSITAVDSATQQIMECAYQNDAPSGDDCPVALGTAYFVRLYEAPELSSGPPPECPETTLVSGVNLVGVGKPPATLTCFEVIASFGAGAVSAVQRLDPDKGAFEACVTTATESIVGIDFPIVAGEGYIVHAANAAGPVNLNDLKHPVCQN